MAMAQETVTDSAAVVVQQPVPVPAVKKDVRPWRERVTFGGSTGFWIQPRQTHVEVAGMVAYHFQKVLSLGTGYRYIYTRNRIYGKNLNSYGPNLFARAQLSRRIYFWTEWENLKTEYVVTLQNDAIELQSDHVDSFYAGFGYIRQLGRHKHGGISIQVLYNFLYERADYSPYYSPVIYRIGYFF